MNVPIGTVVGSLRKQLEDFEQAYIFWSDTRNATTKPSLKKEASENVKRTLADLRNVAACVFFKLQDMEKGL